MKCNDEIPTILQRMKGSYFYGLSNHTLLTTKGIRNPYSETGMRAFIKPAYFQKEDRWRRRKNKYLAHTGSKVKIGLFHIMSLLREV